MQILRAGFSGQFIALDAIVHYHRERTELARPTSFERVAVVMIRRTAHEQLGLDLLAAAAVVVEGDVAAISIGAKGLFQEVDRPVAADKTVPKRRVGGQPGDLANAGR
ncbi:hypothetical protein JIR23_03980 [Bradyrhizobium diazoefficiens]|nr:hypothetical protein JIR23_03980 [Bradyrhizobium diazoefficiens]